MTDKPRDPRRRAHECRATIRSGPRKGEKCRAYAVHGSTCCRAHLRNPQARALAAVRAEVDQWVPGDIVDDPGELLLRLVTQSARRADMLARRLATAVDDAGGDLAAAMVGDTMVTTAEGDTVKVGEYVRGLAQLEAAERDRAHRFAEKAVAAGLAERQVRLAEQRGGMLAEVLAAVLERLDVPPEVIDQVPDLLDEEAARLALVAG